MQVGVLTWPVTSKPSPTSPMRVVIEAPHLKNLRKQWQILALQITATVALVWMYMESSAPTSSVPPHHALQTIEFFSVQTCRWATG